MRQVSKMCVFCHWVLMVIFMLVLPSCTLGETPNSDINIWKGYSAEQKIISMAGFVHGYRTATPHKKAFESADFLSAIQIIDEAVKGEQEPVLGSIVLNSLRAAKRAKSDIHAEHWSGPYGFSTGLWWRALEDNERESYVQGVFWLSCNDHEITLKVPDPSVIRAVKILNDWFDVTDDAWKDSQSNDRVDIPVLIAMQKTKIIVVEAGAQHPK